MDLLYRCMLESGTLASLQFLWIHTSVDVAWLQDCNKAASHLCFRLFMLKLETCVQFWISKFTDLRV